MGMGMGPGMGMGMGMHHGMGPGMMGHGPMGIPPQVAEKLGISPDTVKRVRELTLDMNEQLIPLTGAVQRAQIDLDRVLLDPSADEAKVLPKLEAVHRAELDVRKNRMALMLRVKKLLGPTVWDKLQAEQGPMGPPPFAHGPMGPPPPQGDAPQPPRDGRGPH